MFAASSFFFTYDRLFRCQLTPRINQNQVATPSGREGKDCINIPAINNAETIEKAIIELHSTHQISSFTQK